VVSVKTAAPSLLKRTQDSGTQLIEKVRNVKKQKIGEKAKNGANFSGKTGTYLFFSLNVPAVHGESY